MVRPSDGNTYVVTPAVGISVRNVEAVSVLTSVPAVTSDTVAATWYAIPYASDPLDCQVSPAVDSVPTTAVPPDDVTCTVLRRPALAFTTTGLSGATDVAPGDGANVTAEASEARSFAMLVADGPGGVVGRAVASCDSDT